VAKASSVEDSWLLAIVKKHILGDSQHRGSQTAVFELDIRLSNPPYIDVGQSLASEAGLESRNVEKTTNASGIENWRSASSIR
jgi:tRNA1(Val) A37 N6-methylase TrmN6